MVAPWTRPRQRHGRGVAELEAEGEVAELLHGLLGICLVMAG
jgi:hypothetical protein